MEVGEIADGRKVILAGFAFNKNIMYALIQQTGDTDGDVIAHFFEVGMKLFHDCVQRGVAEQCKRMVRFYYKQCPLQVQLTVESTPLQGKYVDMRMPIKLVMDLKSPSKMVKLSGDKVGHMLAERGLTLGSGSVVTLEKEEDKLYKVLDPSSVGNKVVQLKDIDSKALPEHIRKRFFKTS